MVTLTATGRVRGDDARHKLDRGIPARWQHRLAHRLLDLGRILLVGTFRHDDQPCGLQSDLDTRRRSVVGIVQKHPFELSGTNSMLVPKRTKESGLADDHVETAFGRNPIRDGYRHRIRRGIAIGVARNRSAVRVTRRL
jgi:hypothetical protein